MFEYETYRKDLDPTGIFSQERQAYRIFASGKGIKVQSKDDKGKGFSESNFLFFIISLQVISIGV